MVVEVDESDGTLIHFEPDLLIITNIDYDHLEHHGSADQFLDTFRQLIAHTRGDLFYTQGDRLSDQLCSGLLKASPIQMDERATHYAIPSLYNQKNVSAALAVADRVLGRSIKTHEVALLPKIHRRHEVLFEQDSISIITDYAHHPTEIKALIDAVSSDEEYGHIVVIFQPHRYTRTRAMKQEIAAAFKGVDALCITPVYAASEEAIEGGLAKDLLASTQDIEGLKAVLVEDLSSAWKWSVERLQPGVRLLLVGAGDIDSLRLEVDHWKANY
jgi:UDP-N-acetylmuramate--alanine ligase